MYSRPVLYACGSRHYHVHVCALALSMVCLQPSKSTVLVAEVALSRIHAWISVHHAHILHYPSAHSQHTNRLLNSASIDLVWFEYVELACQLSQTAFMFFARLQVISSEKYLSEACNYFLLHTNRGLVR